jgi:hypothetical protein
MARKKSTVPVVDSLHNMAQPQQVEVPEKMDWDEGIRVAYSYVVNVDENALRWLAMAMELGCTRGMLETCSREGDPVAAVKVLVGRLDRACR